MKKQLSTLISLLLVFCMTFSCFAAGVSFADVDVTTTEGEAIAKLAEAGILNGYLDGKFHAERSLTRAQFCKIANKVFGYTEVGTETFNDVPAKYWGATEISIAQKAGYIKGVGNGNFGPERPLTREQVCIMLVRILGYEPLEFAGQINDPVSAWAVQDVKTALAYFIFSLEAGGKFRAQQAITRGEISVVLSRYLTSSEPMVKPDSEFVMSIKSLSAAFEKMELTAAESKVITPLKACIDKAIAAADAGTDVTKEYFEANYKTELQSIREIYTVMNSSDASAMKMKIAKHVSTKTATTLYDTFLVTQTSQNSSGGGGGGGGGGTTGNENTGGNTGNENTGGNTGNENTGGNTGNENTGGNTGNENTGGNTGNENTGGNTGNENTGGNTGNENTGGDTGNDNTGGNTGDDNEDEPDPIVPDESEVVQAIRQIVVEIEYLYEDFNIYSYEEPVVGPLLECLKAVLDDAANGIIITKPYVKSTYRAEIAEVNSEYSKLKDAQKRGLDGKLGNLDPEASDILYDYFISD